jgi:hypothetical protein
LAGRGIDHDAPPVPERQRGRVDEGIKLKKCCRFSPVATADMIMGRTTEECGRSAACRTIKGPVKAPDPGFTTRRKPPRKRPAKNAVFSAIHSAFSSVWWLTVKEAEDYIAPLGRAAAWRDGASAKPLTVLYGDIRP